MLLQASPLAPVTAPAPTPASALSLEQQTALRCSAAFSIVAARQRAGDAKAGAYPPLATRGREFFVRSSAQLIDQTGLSREAIAQKLRAEAILLNQADRLDSAMPGCLLLLETSGL
ncbi:hypothetical protein GRI94_19690 [Erythrobacter jejuensis]|uniref:Uncharacterized protein n=1 Tax=Parerythrobacter jejuensis TaxID=795812 RepID=A0A845B514_9SPHN|nr:hypothetical protein [Parerythrobacter jejuensis]MXP34058.1 hypothetical protein [Parerythrobacter jejuensis]